MEAINVFGPKFVSKLSIRRNDPNAFRLRKFSRFSATSFPEKHAHLHPLACDDEENNRKFVKLAPNEWDRQSLFADVDFSEKDVLEKEIEALKPKVRDMFMCSKGIKEKILFIYLLESLCLAYHFEDEIEKSVKDGFEKIDEMLAGEDDLYTVSIIFYVFRTYGRNISSDVFKRFKAENGEFKECLSSDGKGILSLYEAANMGTTTDNILDEALSFTLNYLESLAASETCKRNLSMLIQNALHLPQHKNMEVLVAREYIRFYEQEEDCNKTLLHFAKSNFKFLQLHYLEELKILSKWYKEQRFESELPPYYRDRLVEFHLGTLAYMEPKYSRVRIITSKVLVTQVMIDDTCDRYASLREVETLANAIERWDLDDREMDGLPDYLKHVVKFIFDTFQEFEREIGPEELGGFSSLETTIEETKRLVKSNLELARWAKAGHLPSFDEYIDIGLVEFTVYQTSATTMMAMENVCKKEIFEWLKSRDKLIRAIYFKGRVLNDIYGYEDDMSRGYMTGSINCYKKQYGINEEEAIIKLKQLVANNDKIINEEFLKPINVPRQVLKIIIDTFRVISVAYNHDDNYTFPDRDFKKYIKSIYVDLI